MAYVIKDSCIACGACACITDGDIYVIDGSACIDCGSCAGVCPVDAPQPE